MRQRNQKTNKTLKTKIAERLEQRLHPLIPSRTGWRVWPPVIADILAEAEPAHVISLSQRTCYVDGLAIDSTENLEEKLSAARRAIQEVYQISVSKASGFNNHLGIRFRTTFGSKKISFPGLNRWQSPRPRSLSRNVEEDRNKYPLLLEMVTGPSTWQLLVCIPQPPEFSRVAFKAKRVCSEPGENYFNQCPITYAPAIKNDTIWASLAIRDQDLVNILVSREFFENPTPENAKFFGDLCFLSQASNDWRVSGEVVYPATFRSYNIADGLDLFSIVFRLSTTKGFENLLQAAHLQLLFKDKHTNDWEFWRTLAWFAEEITHRDVPFKHYTGRNTRNSL